MTFLICCSNLSMPHAAIVVFLGLDLDFTASYPRSRDAWARTKRHILVPTSAAHTDPDMTNTFQINRGLRLARTFLLQIANLVFQVRVNSLIPSPRNAVPT